MHTTVLHIEEDPQRPLTKVFRVIAEDEWAAFHAADLPRLHEPYKPGSGEVCVIIEGVPLGRNLFEVTCHYREQTAEEKAAMGGGGSGPGVITCGNGRIDVREYHR